MVARWKLERPVKWTSTRTEGYKTDAPGRGHVSRRPSWRWTRTRTITGPARQDLRRRTSARTSRRSRPRCRRTCTGRSSPGQYDIPAIHCNVGDGRVHERRTPVDAYRGAGRPEALVSSSSALAYLGGAGGGRSTPRSSDRRTSSPTTPSPTRRRWPSSTTAASTASRCARQSPGGGRLRRSSANGKKEAAQGGSLPRHRTSPVTSRPVRPRPLGTRRVNSARRRASGSPVWSEFHPSGTVTAFCGTSGHGQGHGTTYAQIVSPTNSASRTRTWRSSRATPTRFRRGWEPTALAPPRSAAAPS